MNNWRSIAARHAAKTLLLLLVLLSCSSPGGGGGEPVQKQAAAVLGAQGAITFYLPYESTVATAEIAGGSSTSYNNEPIQLESQGLFGQAEKSETAHIQWPKAGNIELARPGSLAFWIKPTPSLWFDYNWIFVAGEGERRVLIYNRDGAIRCRMENVVTGQAVEASQGDISSWSTTETGWHLVVASWGFDYVGMSLDGAPTQTASAPWQATTPGGATGYILAGGDMFAGYLLDELFVFNRQLWAGEIQWLWGTRSAPTMPNPAVAKFGASPSAEPQGPITFYVPYELTAAVPSIAGGSSTPNVTDPIQQAPGLFGQGVKSETPLIAWPTPGNIELAQPGAVALWLKPTPQWSHGNWLFMAMEGARKLMLIDVGNQLRAHMEHIGTSNQVQAIQGDISNWGTSDTNWHLVVISWGSDYVGLSVDGAPTQKETASWLAAVPGGTTGWLYAAGEGAPGYVADELTVFNRTIWPSEIQALWASRSSGSSWNPSVNQFSTPDSDNDGVADQFDICPGAPNPSQVDTDGDGLGDECDNCPLRANADQADVDQDGRGDFCDNCITVSNGDQMDVDNNGVGDACDGSILFMSTNNPFSSATKIIDERGTYALNLARLAPLQPIWAGTQGGTASFTPKGFTGQEVMIFDSPQGFGPEDQGGVAAIGELEGGRYRCQHIKFTSLSAELNQSVAAGFSQDIWHVIRYAHGTCSKRIPLRPLFEQMSSELDSQVRAQVNQRISFATVERDVDLFQPYFTSELTDIRMGIFFQARFFIEAPAIPRSEVWMTPGFKFTPKADDGMVSVDSVAQGVVALINPNFVPMVKESIQAALKITVPDKIEQIAANALNRPLSSLAAPIKLNQTTCSHTAPLDAQQNLCFALVQFALGSVDAGPDAGADIERLLAMLSPGAFTCSDDDKCIFHPIIPTCNHAATLTDQQNACFEPLTTQLRLGSIAGDEFANKTAAALERRNFSCNASDQCLFHPVVQQVNVLPHDIELVFSPNPTSPTDNLTPFYAAVQAMSNGMETLCDPLPPAGVRCGYVEIYGHPDAWVALCGENTGGLSCNSTPVEDLTPKLTVISQVRPASAAGRFNLFIDDVMKATNVGNGGTTGPVAVTPGIHAVRETAAGTTILDGYTVRIGGDCSPTGLVTLSLGDRKTCTIINTNICLSDCEAERDDCMADVSQPGGPTAQLCAQVFLQCQQACH